MNHAIAVCEAGMARMQEAVRPGVTENDLFATIKLLTRDGIRTIDFKEQERCWKEARKS